MECREKFQAFALRQSECCRGNKISILVWCASKNGKGLSWPEKSPALCAMRHRGEFFPQANVQLTIRTSGSVVTLNASWISLPSRNASISRAVNDRRLTLRCLFLLCSDNESEGSWASREMSHNTQRWINYLSRNWCLDCLESRGETIPRKYVFDVGQRSSPWTWNLVKVGIKFYLGCKLHFPCTQFMLRLLTINRERARNIRKWLISALSPPFDRVAARNGATLVVASMRPCRFRMVHTYDASTSISHVWTGTTQAQA